MTLEIQILAWDRHKNINAIIVKEKNNLIFNLKIVEQNLLVFILLGIEKFIFQPTKRCIYKSVNTGLQPLRPTVKE